MAKGKKRKKKGLPACSVEVTHEDRLKHFQESVGSYYNVSKKVKKLMKFLIKNNLPFDADVSTDRIGFTSQAQTILRVRFQHEERITFKKEGEE